MTASIDRYWLERARRLMHRVYPCMRRPRLWATPRSTAYHEAAHAVAMEVTGRTCTGATIECDRAAHGMRGQAFAGSPMPSEQRDMRPADAPLSAPMFPDQKPLLMCWAAMLYAGSEAECRLRGITLDGFVEWPIPDHYEAEWLLSIAFGPRRGTTPAAGCQALAREIVATNWPEIEAVADELMACGTLDGDAVRATIATARQSNNDFRGRPSLRPLGSRADSLARRPALPTSGSGPRGRADLRTPYPALTGKPRTSATP